MLKNSINLKINSMKKVIVSYSNEDKPFNTKEFKIEHNTLGNIYAKLKEFGINEEDVNRIDIFEDSKEQTKELSDNEFLDTLTKGLDEFTKQCIVQIYKCNLDKFASGDKTKNEIRGYAQLKTIEDFAKKIKK